MAPRPSFNSVFLPFVSLCCLPFFIFHLDSDVFILYQFLPLFFRLHWPPPCDFHILQGLLRSLLKPVQCSVHQSKLSSEHLLFFTLRRPSKPGFVTSTKGCNTLKGIHKGFATPCVGTGHKLRGGEYDLSDGYLTGFSWLVWRCGS